jgi:hypothetical protein
VNHTAGLGVFGEEANLLSLLSFEPRFLVRSAHSLVTPLIIIPDNILDWLMSLVRHSMYYPNMKRQCIKLHCYLQFCMGMNLVYLVLRDEVRGVGKSEE